MHPIPVIRNSPEDGRRREQTGFRYNFIMEDADEGRESPFSREIQDVCLFGGHTKEDQQLNSAVKNVMARS